MIHNLGVYEYITTKTKEDLEMSKKKGFSMNGIYEGFVKAAANSQNRDIVSAVIRYGILMPKLFRVVSEFRKGCEYAASQITDADQCVENEDGGLDVQSVTQMHTVIPSSKMEQEWKEKTFQNIQRMYNERQQRLQQQQAAEDDADDEDEEESDSNSLSDILGSISKK
jgi:hypothetical protein